MVNLFLSDNFVYTLSFGKYIDYLIDFLNENKLFVIWYNYFEDYWVAYSEEPEWQVRMKILRILQSSSRNLYIFRKANVVIEDIFNFCNTYFHQNDAWAFNECLVYTEDYLFSGIVYFKGMLTLGSHFYNLRYVYDFCLFCELMQLEYDAFCGSEDKVGVLEDIKLYVYQTSFFN